MKKLALVHRLPVYLAGSFFLFIGSSLFAASSTLTDYFYTTGQILPNNFAISLSEDVTFNDNINEGTRENAHSAWEFNTDVNVDINKTIGYSTYGLQGSVGWNHYHNGNRDSEPDIDLSPYFTFAQDKGNLLLDAGIQYKDESLSNSDRRFAKYYDAILRIGYDLNSHERYGMILSTDYQYQYYTDNEFDNNDNAKYGISMAPYYKVSPKTKVGMRLGYERTDYRSNREHDDLDEMYLNLFVNYQIAMKINLTAEAGFTRSSYDGGSSEGSTGDDGISPNYRLLLAYQMLSNLAFSLQLSHEPADSFELGAQGLTQQNKSTLGMTWMVNPKLSLVQSVSVFLEDEKTTEMDTTQYEYDARMNYQLRKQLMLHAGYTYSTTHFKYVEDNNFKSNEITLGVSWTF